MDPEIQHRLDTIEKKVDHAIELLEEKHHSLEGRVGRLEKGMLGVLVAFVGSAFTWLFKR